MDAVFVLPGVLAAALAGLLPFGLGLAAVVVLAPVSNAYVAAAAMAVLLGRWLLSDLPVLSATKRSIRWASVVGGFLVLAMVQSVITSSNLLRLASESAQWVLGVGLFLAATLSMTPELKRNLVRALAVSPVLLTAIQSLLRFLEISPEESSAIPMLSWPNNYVSLLALFGLIVLPIAIPEAISTKLRIPMIAFAFLAMYANESRAALLLGALTLLGWLIVMKRDVRWVLPAAVVVGVAGALAVGVVVRGAIADPAGVASLGNFQTNFSNLERLGILIYAWELFLATPFGSGIGSSSDIFIDNPYTLGSYPDAHNMLAMLGVELGWLGVIAYSAFAVFLLAQTWRCLLAGNPRVLLPGMLFLTTFYDAWLFNGVLAAYFWLFLALLAAPAESAQRWFLVVESGKV